MAGGQKYSLWRGVVSVGMVDTCGKDRTLEQYRRGFWHAAGDEPGIHRSGVNRVRHDHLLLPAD